MNQAELRNLRVAYFNSSELHNLCFDLGVNYENLRGQTLEDKARELITLCHRYNLTESLIQQCRNLRPMVPWPEVEDILDSLNTVSNSLSDPQFMPHQSIEGNYNAVSGHMGHSTVNITNIHQVLTEDSAALLKRGIQLTQAHAYDYAIKALNLAIESDPSEPANYYYLALALLKGRRPKVLTRSEAEVISQYLQTSCALNDSHCEYYYLWALVKHDFYASHGFSVGTPNIVELLEKAIKLKRNYKAIREMLNLIPPLIGNPVYDIIRVNLQG